MDNLTRAEKIAFNADHARYYAQQEAAERRAAMVEQRTKDLMQVGEEYHPWSFQNFEEAIANAPDSDRVLMFTYIAAAVDQGLKNDHTNHLALVGLRQLVERYWTKCAAQAADEELTDLSDFDAEDYE